MRNLLHTLHFIFAVLSQAKRQGSEIDLYLNYLKKFEKSLLRISEPARVTSFFSSISFISNFKVNENINEKNSATPQFYVGLNEMSDWLEHEIEYRFPSQQSNISDEMRSSATSTPKTLESSAWRKKGKNCTTDHVKPPSAYDSALLVSPKSPKSSDNSSLFDGEGGTNKDGLNWASTLNPKGASVLSAVRNQGLCGACWAFVATSSVEALVRIAGGKQIPLSVQELVDCDTAMNRGCNGGNPLYAFEYTMSNALTSWNDYPYRETASVCRRTQFRARSSVEGYRRLPANDQVQLLQYVSMAPVAVGICGTDKSFMFYSRGIYNAANCCSVQNHAVLLVGYGHDTATNLDFWIALNSWGITWGERGYVRLLRTNDSASPGQCGLAMNPVAAMGGYVLRKEDLEDERTNDKKGDKQFPHAHPLPFGAAFTVWLENNWQNACLALAAVLMTISIVLLAFTAYHDYKEAQIEKRRKRGSGSVGEYSGYGHGQDTDHRMIPGTMQGIPGTQYYQQIRSFENISQPPANHYHNPNEHEHENVGTNAQNGSSWMSSLSNPFSVSAHSSQPHHAYNRPSNIAEIEFTSRMSASGTDSHQREALSDYPHHMHSRESGGR